MAREKNSKTHNIFLLNKEKVQEKFFNGEDRSIEEIIRVLLLANGEYSEQSLKPLPAGCNFDILLFFKQEVQPHSRLSSFCAPFVRDDQPIIRFRTQTASSILFLWSENNIFAVTTGQGFRIIEEYCVPKFGMIVISIFNDLFKITALDSNGMSSIVHSNKTIYSNEVDFVNVESLDTVFKEVTGRLNSKAKVHELLDLDEKSKKRSVKITGKNYVQFSSSLSFKGLLHLLSILDTYDFSTLNESFNLIAPLNRNRDSHEIAENNQKVIELLYNSVTTGAACPFDLFHKTTTEFVGADTYMIEVNGTALSTTDDIDTIPFVSEAYQEYLQDEPDSLDAFSDFIYIAKIKAEKGETIITSGLLLDHVSGELQRDGKSYYIFYGDYYYLSESYSDRLNYSLKGKLQKDRFTELLTTVWHTGDKEDDFNRNASNDEGYIHLHKVKPEYIEFADLMKVDDTSITLFHVKDGFDCDMRALDRQVEMSITRVLDAKNNNNTEYLRKLYANACENRVGINIAAAFNSADAFIEAIKQRDVNFVIAIHPPRSDLLSCPSNIAKHCLNALILRCFNQGIDLKINIIKDE